MKKKIFYLLFAATIGTTGLHAQWKPVSGKIMTPWAEKVNAASPLPEYPRPQLIRNHNWKNLNGLWQYAVLPGSGADAIPEQYDGNILVPYAIESALSGVGRTVGKDSILWYTRVIDVPASMRKGKLLLHFGAVDWAAQIYVNGVKVGEHEGGYDPFSIDITSAVKKGSRQSVSVRVWDPSDDGPQPAGKQVKNPHGIWYTPVTGIWQTVWLENVPETYIVATKQTPDIDQQQLQVSVNTAGLQPGDEISVSAWDGTKQVASQASADGQNVILRIPDPKLWSPQRPFLYDLKVSVKRKGKTIDEATSYFGMRKISMAKDANGIQRMMLNNQFLFQYGPLDQGWWPDGLYTAPTDEALKFDVEQTRALGFNMIRKHIKVEPARWYYYCDQLGILVWQDMPSGDRGGNIWSQQLRVKMPEGKKVDDSHLLKAQVPGLVFDRDRSAASEAYYRKEWESIMDVLHNHPSIVVWVPFNEAWGQFKTKEIVDWTMKKDPSRMVNGMSGGNFFIGVSPVVDLHYYPGPAMPDPEIYGQKQILVLGEFGGLGLPVKDHLWLDKGNWGYRSFDNNEKLFEQYSEMIGSIPDLIKWGLSAAVYTQTTDVEIETNGLFTYDRKVLKFPKDKMFQLHQQLYNKGLVSQ
ncbi:sugar-binding domain-containing protein [Niabella sp.]|uniref:glycoside hydrolase family 2 protein n=1 Tax=Niabella sp. TaxID=1962976 RepID=UPI0026315776|nr:sugar-binding domain-containing protein [Niabella sp.]